MLVLWSVLEILRTKINVRVSVFGSSYTGTILHQAEILDGSMCLDECLVVQASFSQHG